VGGRVEISVSAEAGAINPWLRFAVRDTGIGIARELQARLFQPFNQADSSIPGRFGGSGLGLSISRRLAERMGGEIGLESSPGEGSTFWFRIPLVAAQGAPAPPATAPEQMETGKTGGRRILLVDDNLVNQKVAGAMLRKLRYAVDLAENGEEALSALSQNTYDLVLMDCQMPVMDGFEATAEIRRREAGLQGAIRMPIIALTASAMPEDRQRCSKAGMDDFVLKPIDPAQLKAALERSVSSRKQRSSQEESLDDAEKKEMMVNR
jgi:two-component system, sensor histidine kinase and response regulator